MHVLKVKTFITYQQRQEDVEVLALEEVVTVAVVFVLWVDDGGLA